MFKTLECISYLTLLVLKFVNKNKPTIIIIQFYSIQFLFIYVPTQQPKDQLQSQHE
jgi:hypothetical protein